MVESLSFVIPALNEADNIGRVISSIKRTVPGNPEIIVCDNGSTDDTLAIASGAGAKTIQDTNATIAGLRNLGVEKSHGDYLVFLDADIELDRSWFPNFQSEFTSFPKNGLYISGSRYQPATRGDFLEQNWFRLLPRNDLNYINSGHLITTRTLFQKLGGFDTKLVTGEDYDLCIRARRSGASILPRDRLIAFHHGYPRKISDFIRRETWHGQEDMASLSSFLSSKTATAAVGNLILIIFSLISFFTGWYILGIILLLTAISFPLLIVCFKIGSLSPYQTVKTALCAEIYLIARAISFVPAFSSHWK